MFCIKLAGFPPLPLRNKPRGWASWTRGCKLAKDMLSNYYYRLHDETGDNRGGLIGPLLVFHSTVNCKMGARVMVDQIRKGAEYEEWTAKPP